MKKTNQKDVWFMKITVVRPSEGHSAYKIAAEAFTELCKKVSDLECVTVTDREVTLASDLVVLIGSDSVNNLTANLYLEMKTESFKIRYCTDDYCIRTVEADGVRYLIFAGGRGRSTIYAVYRYFELYMGCRWFWDGDRIKQGALKTEGIDLTESPRFDYRGLRYFAHRSLHRFQAEHWGFEDWKIELDWMMKKRLNLFMLRIGMDDIFQKAFPDVVSYPDRDKVLPEAGPGYDDRTLFWSLEYRGELRKKILRYAFERDLMHPEDCGTMTHWYSRTPLEFLEKRKPKFLPQATSTYGEPTGLVWDVRENENLNNYFKLTEAHAREYGNGEIFHTIGLGERNYSADPEKNRRMKLYVYRRITNYIKEHYPNSPLLIASWDLWMRFTPEEVRELMGELDPKQSILLDYTSDTACPNNFTNWNVQNNFPWIFGIFSGYEWESEVRGYYPHTNERLKLAKDDPACKGLILWPELSHGDPLITEYLALNGWEKDTLSIPDFLNKFCSDRYDERVQGEMTALWQEFMPIVTEAAWSMFDSWWNCEMPVRYPIKQIKFDKEKKAYYKKCIANRPKYRDVAVKILRNVADMQVIDHQHNRDLFDIARTILERYIDAAIWQIEFLFFEGEGEKMLELMEHTEALTQTFADLLSIHEDYSLYASLEKLKAVTETNPNFEITLKNNAECGYCRSYIYENAEYLYTPELKCVFDEAKKAFAGGTELDSDAIQLRGAEIRASYMALSLAEMEASKKTHTFSEVCLRASTLINKMQFED